MTEIPKPLIVYYSPLKSEQMRFATMAGNIAKACKFPPEMLKDHLVVTGDIEEAKRLLRDDTHGVAVFAAGSLPKLNDPKDKSARTGSAEPSLSQTLARRPDAAAAWIFVQDTVQRDLVSHIAYYLSPVALENLGRDRADPGLIRSNIVADRAALGKDESLPAIVTALWDACRRIKHYQAAQEHPRIPLTATEQGAYL